MTITLPSPSDRALLLRISRMQLAKQAIYAEDPTWAEVLKHAANAAGELADEAEAQAKWQAVTEGK